MDELVFSSAQALVRHVVTRKVSASELLDAHLAQIARHNPTLNAVVTLDEEGARTRARQADEALARGELWGPLHGLPMTLKDGLSTGGMRTTAGFPPLANYIPERDGTVAARLKAAGAIIIGKTNVPVLLSQPQTDNPIFGRTNNPWDLSRTSGGSSGGACAAVASGMVPLEIGSDLAGSIRIPSHFCGVCGLKPTARRVPQTGHIPDLPGASRFDRWCGVSGPIARSVGDLALALRVIAGPDGQDTEVPPVQGVDLPPVSLHELRVAWAPTFPGVPVAGSIQDTVQRVAAGLDECGAAVEQALPDLDVTWQHDIWALYYRLLDHAWIRMTGTADTEGPDPSPSMMDLVEFLAQRDALIQGWEQFFSAWDVLLCPAAPVTAFPHCPPGTPLSVDGRSIDAGQISHHAYPFSLTGHPTVTLPASQDRDGLPVGVQLVGHRWNDERLLAIAGCVADITGTFRRPPGYDRQTYARDA
jgi:amidase